MRGSLWELHSGKMDKEPHPSLHVPFALAEPAKVNGPGGLTGRPGIARVTKMTDSCNLASEKDSRLNSSALKSALIFHLNRFVVAPPPPR